jgi:hypothetical protein
METKEGGWLPIGVIVTCHMHHTAHKEWKLVQGGWFVQSPPSRSLWRFIDGVGPGI